MKRYTSITILGGLFGLLLLSSCAKKLDLFPQNDLTPEKTYSTPAGYKAVLTKIYSTLSITGNNGPAGDPDIRGGLDEGSQVAFIRMFFNCQELPTDEAVVAWNDQTIQDFHNLRWTPADPFLLGIYARPIYNITLINEYLRESTDAKLAERNITGVDADDIRRNRAEARFLRAFNYWVMLDLFGKSTFITEENKVGTDIPGEIDRPALFEYIQTELKAVETEMAQPRTLEYGRVDQAAAWALHSNYAQLFMADNDKWSNEFIFAINCDGRRTQAYGNTTFFVHAASGDDHNDFGVGSGWFGYRATKGLADLFSDLTGATDKRALFTTSSFGTSPAQIAISDVTNFANGLHVNKYKNIRSDGAAVSDVNREFSDIDFPIFRLPEMYLIYTEAVLRGGTGGDLGTATGYINLLRQRAYGGNSGNVSQADINLRFVLDERGRELYWEGHRRTDLIRYGLLTTGSYLWPWKGGVSSGTAVSDKYNLFPIPSANRTSNPNLTQNDGY